MKIAVVTGSSYGIGKSISEMLLEEGFKVYGVSRSDAKIKDQNFVWIKADLLEDQSFELIKNSVQESSIDILVNNAGTAFESSSLEFKDQDFDRMFGLNFKAPIKLSTTLLSKLKNNLIINISSLSDRFTDKESGLYSASKAALNIYFEGIADADKSVKIINMLPDYVDTPLQHILSDNIDFDWDQVMESRGVAESVKHVISHINDIKNCSKIIVTNNKMISDIEDPENLWYYNVDTSEFKKIK